MSYATHKQYAQNKIQITNQPVVPKKACQTAAARLFANYPKHKIQMVIQMPGGYMFKDEANSASSPAPSPKDLLSLYVYV